MSAVHPTAAPTGEASEAFCAVAPLCPADQARTLAAAERRASRADSSAARADAAAAAEPTAPMAAEPTSAAERVSSRAPSVGNGHSCETAYKAVEHEMELRDSRTLSRTASSRSKHTPPS
jgi:hypothetical protein